MVGVAVPGDDGTGSGPVGVAGRADAGVAGSVAVADGMRRTARDPGAGGVGDAAPTACERKGRVGKGRTMRGDSMGTLAAELGVRAEQVRKARTPRGGVLLGFRCEPGACLDVWRRARERYGTTGLWPFITHTSCGRMGMGGRTQRQPRREAPPVDHRQADGAAGERTPHRGRMVQTAPRTPEPRPRPRRPGPATHRCLSGGRDAGTEVCGITALHLFRRAPRVDLPRPHRGPARPPGAPGRTGHAEPHAVSRQGSPVLPGPRERPAGVARSVRRGDLLPRHPRGAAVGRAPPSAPSETARVTIEHYAYCPDLDQVIGGLPEVVLQVPTRTWFFWWD